MKLFLRFEIFLCGLFCLLLVVFVVVLFNENCENWIRGLLDLPGKNEVLQFLGFGMGGTLFVLQVLASNKRAKAMEDTATAQAQANLYTETGLRQDRLKNAIEHLGHESDSVRLGGAYELLHLARDTEEYRKTVLEILCAHIRRMTGETIYQQTNKSTPSQEIHSLLILLFIQENETFSGLHADLQESFLNGANLHGACLNNALLSGTSLQGAVLGRAYLLGANLMGTNLNGAILGSALMRGAVLIETSLQGANLVDTCLQGAILENTNMHGALLKGAQLQGIKNASFEKTKPGMSIEFSDLIRSSIGRDSNLSGIVLGGIRRLKEIESFIRHRGAITGSYTKIEAEEWIAEYEKTTSKTPTKSAHTGDEGSSLFSFLSPS